MLSSQGHQAHRVLLPDTFWGAQTPKGAGRAAQGVTVPVAHAGAGSTAESGWVTGPAESLENPSRLGDKGQLHPAALGPRGTPEWTRACDAHRCC